MNSIILQTIARYLLVLMLLFSWWVLFRGHNSPGGGFIAGLIAASAFSLYLIAYEVKRLRRLLVIELPIALATGLLLVFGSGLLGVLQNKPFLTAVWFKNVPFGSPLIFDVGIYLVVVGSVLVVIYALEEYS